ADRAARRAQTGDDEEAVLPLLMNLADLFARADDAVEPGRVREVGQSHDLVVGTAAHAGAGQVTFVEASEHRHRDDAGVLARRGLRILHHRSPTAGVNRDDRRLEHVNRLHRAGHRIGNVVQLEVEEDRQADVRDLVHTMVAVRAEELEPELEAADMRLDLFGQRPRRVELRQVERQVDRIGHGAGITFSVGAGFASKGSLAAGVGGAGAIAEARAALSREAMRRSLFQRVALCSSHIGTSPSRNALTTKAGTFVSRTRPSQILTSTGFQLLIEKISNATSSKTQTIVRTIF